MASLTAASIVSGLCEAGILLLVVRIALAIGTGDDKVELNLGPLADETVFGIPTLFGAAFGLVVLRLLMEWVAAFVPARISADVQVILRQRTFGDFLRSSWDVQAKERDGHLQDLMTTQITQAAQSVLYLAIGLTMAFNLIALLAAALFVNFIAALLTVAAAAGLFVALRPMTLITKRHSATFAAAGVDYANAVTETMNLSQEVRVLGATERVNELVDAQAETVSHAFFRYQYLSGLVPAIYRNVALGLVISGLAGLYALGADRLASLGAIVLILLRALTYSQGLQVVYQKVTGLSPYIDRIQDAHGRYSASADQGGDRPLGTVDQLSFEDVSFSYVPGRPVLRNVTFEARIGEAIGIVGPSGAGKSTFVQLLLRLRVPDSGRFSVNGVDAREWARDDWYRRLAYVPQDSRIFSGTVRDNIRFFREDVDDVAIERAARLAHIHEEVMTWADGYSTAIGQRADAISGGQRQRICLARALARDPEIIVLDEPTSALDVKSETLVRKSLNSLRGTVTVFIVAHRLSTLSNCDRIMVFKNGRLEAFGSPAEVRTSNAFFEETVAISRQP